MDALQLVKRLKQSALPLDEKYDDALAASEQPKNAEIITEWILFVLSSPSAQDERYWHLLHRVLQHQQTIAPRKLLKYSQSVAPILSQLLSAAPNATSWKYVQPTLTRLWPSILLLDTLFDLFTRSVKLLVQHIPTELAESGLEWVVERVTAYFKQALGNANPSMKKKIYASFNEDLLTHWSISSSRPVIYDAGTDVLFNLDILRVHLHPEAIFAADIPANVIAQLFSSYMLALKKYKSALFHQSQSSSSQSSSRESCGMWFLTQAWDYLSNKDTQDRNDAQVKLLEVIQHENSYIPEESKDVVKSCITNAQLDALVILCRIDYESTILPELGTVLSLLLSEANPLDTKLSLLDEILKHHIKTRTLDVLFEAFLSAPILEDCVLHAEILRELARSVRMGFLLPAQQDAVSQTMAQRIKEAWKTYSSSLVASDDEEQPKKKKRRTSLERSVGSTEVIALDIATRLIAFIYHAFPSPATPLDIDLAKLVKKSIKLRQKGAPRKEADPALASLLRLSYSLGTYQDEFSLEVDKFLGLLEEGDVTEGLCVEIYRLLLSHLSPVALEKQQAIVRRLVLDINKFDSLRTMVAERWLPTLDGIASVEDLEAICSAIFDPKLGSSFPMVSRVLDDPEFWELSHIQMAFTSLLRKSHAQGSGSDTIFGWEMLLRIPWEYLARADRRELMGTALASLNEGDNVTRKARMEFALQCLRSMETDEGADMTYDDILQQLTELQSQTTTDDVRAQLAETLVLKALKTQSTPPSKLIQASQSNVWLFLSLVRAVDSNAVIPEGWTDSLATLYTSWSSSMDNPEVYWHWLILGRILGITITPSVKRSHYFVKRSLNSAHALSVFGMAIEEYRASPEGETLDLVLAAYVVLQGHADVETRSAELDAMLAMLCFGMNVEEYGQVLELAIEMLQGVQVRSSEGAVKLAECLLKEPPQGTMHLTQSFATRCMDLFLVRRDDFFHSSVLCSVLHFVHSRWTDRPASLRLVDLTSAWSILAYVLAASNVDEANESTSSTILKLVLDILLAMIRLRRDLIQLTLPHLVVILRRLISLVRTPRPTLGSKQLSNVRNTMPAWFHSFHHPKLLSRVLEALTTKTVPVILSSATKGTVQQKAQSLARPLTKHAFSILSAYIDVLTDPLAVVSRQMRNDLESGIFAICSMMGDWERKAGMASLGNGRKSQADDTKKALFKAVWTEYEKQHYVGLG